MAIDYINLLQWTSLACTFLFSQFRPRDVLMGIFIVFFISYVFKCTYIRRHLKETYKDEQAKNQLNFSILIKYLLVTSLRSLDNTGTRSQNLIVLSFFLFMLTFDVIVSNHSSVSKKMRKISGIE